MADSLERVRFDALLLMALPLVSGHDSGEIGSSETNNPVWLRRLAVERPLVAYKP